MNKKGQEGETLTWIFATILIVVVLFASIGVTTIITKKVVLTFSTGERADLLVTKSLVAYLLTLEGDKTIYENLSNSEDLNDFDGNLAVRIFRGLYSQRYSSIWMGIGWRNNFFGANILGIQKSPFPVRNRFPFVSEIIKIQDRDLKLVLAEGK